LKNGGIVIATIALAVFTHPLLNAGAQGDEQIGFSFEKVIVPIRKPVALPDSALRALERDSAVVSCLAEQGLPQTPVPGSWFVASEVHLSKSDQVDYVVLPAHLEAEDPKRPAPNACFYYPYTGQFWIIRSAEKQYEVILSIATHDLSVLQTRRNGYRNIETGISSLQGRSSGLYKFDGHRYKLWTKHL
jgi:hypothetical protein